MILKEEKVKEKLLTVGNKGYEGILKIRWELGVIKDILFDCKTEILKGRSF